MFEFLLHYHHLLQCKSSVESVTVEKVCFSTSGENGSTIYFTAFLVWSNCICFYKNFLNKLSLDI